MSILIVGLRTKKGRGTSTDMSKLQLLVQEMPGTAQQLRGVLSQKPPRRGTGIGKALTGQPKINDRGQVIKVLDVSQA